PVPLLFGLQDGPQKLRAVVGCAVATDQVASRLIEDFHCCLPLYWFQRIRPHILLQFPKAVDTCLLNEQASWF
ncbi:hypothetical protein C1X11_28130, partial [Escherichia coli]|uniref:hypothetical protein n=1 Tax=Escherichia coli TaxID=562 RepID=UPI000CAC7303